MEKREGGKGLLGEEYNAGTEIVEMLNVKSKAIFYCLPRD
jgi:hypothetical protein